MSTKNEIHALHVQSKINIMTDGSRGVTLSQVISTADQNGANSGGYPNNPYQVSDNQKKIKSPEVKMIKSADKSRDKTKNHRHRHLAITDNNRDTKDHSKPHSTDHSKSQKTETKGKHGKSSSKDGSDKRHGKPSSVKSRSSKRSSARSSRSSVISEPNPILPGANAKDLADLLLEKLSGTSISDDQSTLRLSSLRVPNDDLDKSQTDRSFFSEVSKEEYTKKFTVNDGRPLDKNEKPEVRVRFENSNGGRFGLVPEKNRQLLSAHAPLSAQLYVSKKYPSNFEQATQQNDIFDKGVQTDFHANLKNDPSTTTILNPGQRETEFNGQKLETRQISSFISQPSSKTHIAQPSCKYYANLTPTLTYDNSQVVTVHMKNKEQDNSTYRIRPNSGPFPARNYYGYVPPASGPLPGKNYY